MHGDGDHPSPSPHWSVMRGGVSIYIYIYIYTHTYTYACRLVELLKQHFIVGFAEVEIARWHAVGPLNPGEDAACFWSVRQVCSHPACVAHARFLDYRVLHA